MTINYTSVFCNNGTMFSRLAITYGNTVVNHLDTGVPEVGECILIPGEYIQKVEVHVGYWNGFDSIVGLTFVTTHKICGHFGSEGTKHVISGNHLQYFEIRNGDFLHCIRFVFQSC